MKIGILTYHRSYNYGALLQAISLRKVLEDMGHHATYIDYWPDHNRHRYSLFSFTWMLKTQKGVKGKIRYVIGCITNFDYRKKRNSCFKDFISLYIHPYLSTTDETYDVIVYGSDQIWRKQPEINSYNPVYFGKNKTIAKRHISYAASMGKLPETLRDKDLIKDYVSSLDSISVRERDLQTLLVELGIPNIKLVVDPTLLLSAEKWEKILKITNSREQDNYVLYYNLQNSFDLDEIKSFADRNKLRVKVISGRNRSKSEEDYQPINPQQFVQLIANASFVFTSSFHGLAFSLLFHKPFLVSFRNNPNRAYSLLSLLNLTDRLISPNSKIDSIACKEVDFTVIDDVLESLRSESIQFLIESVCQF